VAQWSWLAGTVTRLRTTLVNMVGPSVFCTLALLEVARFVSLSAFAACPSASSPTSKHSPHVPISCHLMGCNIYCFILVVFFRSVIETKLFFFYEILNKLIIVNQTKKVILFIFHNPFFIPIFFVCFQKCKVFQNIF
jgi:hypothetical protein